jgi:hypothetical protein
MSVTINARYFEQMICGQCGIGFYVPAQFQKEQMNLGSRGGWYCPNGHQRAYCESDADKLRRERDQLKQSIAYEQDRYRAEREAREAAERRVRAARGQITKLKNRASKGVCLCCNRHFTNLERHMHSQHPGFASEPDATAAIN